MALEKIKISQGAKSGHGGVLPAAKNNQEIAEIKGIKPHTDVLSPPGHSLEEMNRSQIFKRLNQEWQSYT